MTEIKFDLVVLGGGPGGYVAAIRASQLGMKTALIEKENLGGICLNWGCIPTKSLLRSSEVFHIIKNADQFGMSVKDVSFDLNKIIKRSRDVANRLSSGVKMLLKKNKVTIFNGHGRLSGNGLLKVSLESEGEVLVKSNHIVLATGARAKTFPGLEPDGDKVWTYKEAMVPKEIPNSLLVVGSGAIGIEFASFYRTLGVDVTVVEVLENILPSEDKEISQFAGKAFKKQGINIITNATVEKLEDKGDEVTVTIDKKGTKQSFNVQRVILAMGIIGNVENIGLEETDIKIENSHVVTDDFGYTNVNEIYAIGDLTGPPWLAHKASHEAIICCEKIAGLKPVPLDKSRIPGCTYCIPQIASIGMTETESERKGHKIRVGRFPFAGNGKAIALGDDQGFVKTIFDKETGELLGAHMVGSEVTELIQGFSVAKTLESTEKELMETIFPHPTLSEMMHESVLDAYGRVIHF